MTDERTRPDVATLASEIMRAPHLRLIEIALHWPEELRSVAASALTQAPDRAERVDTTASDRDPSGGEPL